MLLPLLHILLTTVVSAAPGAAAQAPNERPPGDPQAGFRVFLRYGCYECHGTTGQGGGEFAPAIAPNPLPFVVYYRQLRKPRGVMPMYTRKVLPDEDVLDIYAYLKHLPPAKSAKDIPQINTP